MNPEYSFIIPVYNRPEEIRELLESMRKLISKVSFEVVIIEDGSSVRADEVVRNFSEDLNVRYYYKANSGPGDSRNYGMKKAKADYFIILDSDVILPEYYLMEVHKFISNEYCDCFGGPDAAHPSFSNVQKAIDYTMTSFFTTGGIRGGAKKGFQPRSFNMGISRKAFEASQGFGYIHPGEDPDLSLRLEKEGFKICLIPEAKVFHKRRIDWSKFYLQVKKFGMVRPILNKWHPGSSKLTYWFPSLFMLGFIFSVLMAILGEWFYAGSYLIYFLIIGIDATIKNKSIYIGLLAIRAVFVQFTGYGLGFLNSSIKTGILNRQPEKEFPQLFFKKNAGA
ncbi:cellulose synthase/poly-beta-1,6-N-acetylglucosamine synthase-like glycosyltransferase [Christiangramia gaetbulicola]|uniref:Cellulose synthase/poly-beta-1,6-N-acetylglucosamine synthase-like glycosyltransferase n=1 Tax=Christiangramia gaetbulicola TaxID=703340 RepID=A0A2T6AIU5_9FLAO|nr:glycosyltransferase [Christiangramia gaetbulicola]PTX43748.1 cellulose synthase/poly-beta-1,6-N-acetylglucosamine synthase-like glycosyltransferase [Christiangramia gaetbulicola]